MADDDQSALSSITSGIGKVLPYAVPAVLGAAMAGFGGSGKAGGRDKLDLGGAAAGALAGGAEAAGANEEAAYRQAIEQGRIRHEQAQDSYMQAMVGQRSQNEADKVQNQQAQLEDRQKRTAAYTQAVQNREKLLGETSGYHNQLLKLQQMRVSLTGKALEQNQAKIDETSKALNLSMEKLADEQAKVETGEHWFVSGDTENEFQQNARQDFLEKMKANLGIGDTPKTAPSPDSMPKSSPSDKLRAAGKPATKAASQPQGAIPKKLWGQKNVTGPDGKKWNIDKMGKATPTS